MRIITSYACTLDVETSEEAVWRFNLYRGVMDDWLRDQGIGDPRVDSPADTFIQLTRRDVSHEGAEINGFLLKEPILESSHILHTRFDLAFSDRSLALFLQFSVERLTSRIAPVSYQVSCPRALQTILDAGNWKSGQARVRPHCRRAFGTEAGHQLKNEIWDPNRALPIVLIANLEAPEWAPEFNHPEPYPEAEWQVFADALEADIGAVAQIVEVDSLASQSLDPDMEGILLWVVWPFGSEGFLPNRHPAWAPFDYYYEVEEGDYNYDIHYGGSGMTHREWTTLFRRHELMGLRPTIRNTIYEQAALQPIPGLIEDIRRAYEQAERKRLADTGDWEQMAQSYERDVARERERADYAEERRDELERKLDEERRRNGELQRTLDRRGARSASSAATLTPTATTEPDTVVSALHRATQTCQHLVFGKDVWNSANEIESEPALAKKVLTALQALNEGTESAAQGTLGTALASWIYERHAIESSSEHEPQTFKDEQGKARKFSMHLKLKEATAANKAARIYYDHLSDEGKTLVGYIGPHL